MKTSYSISTSHPVPLPKQESPAAYTRDWRSSVAAPSTQSGELRANGATNLPTPIRFPKLAPFRVAHPQQRIPETNSVRSVARAALKPTSPLPKPAAPVSDIYYAGGQRPRKLVKQVFFTNRKPATAATSEKGNWYKMPAEDDTPADINAANTASEDNKQYRRKEVSKPEESKKTDLKSEDSSQFHYIHIVDRK